MPSPALSLPSGLARPGLPRLGRALCLGAALALAGGALADTPRPKPRPDPAVAGSLPDSPAGTYLAARQASSQNDFAAAAKLYSRALALDPGNPALLEGAATARLALGDIAGAAAAARATPAGSGLSQAQVLALLADDAAKGNFAALKTDLDAGNSIGQMTDRLVLAWALLGQGSMTDALAAFDKMAGDSGMKGFALYHKALAMALSGDFEGADAILSGPDLGPMRTTRRAVVARIEVLAQLDRRAEAKTLLDQAFPADTDAAMDALRARLSGTGPIAFDIVTSPRDGVAEVFFDMASALTGQAEDAYVLLFARTAAALRPGHVEAVMLSAQLLQRMDQQALAARTFALIPESEPAFLDAEIGRANSTLAAGGKDEAIAILTALQAAHPDDRDVAQSLADALRRLNRMAEAVVQYDRAIALTPNVQPDDWILFYARAICLSEVKRWPDAERDFRKALELNPGQPQVLNYLGYSYVDRGENLDEALKMIQRAVLAAPDQGYIVDSLAWAYYRLGRFREAVVPMERASLLMPIDAVVTDHLGDVYWMVGRKMEAEFQWRRALSFQPDEATATRIHRKLDLGLDEVLAQEKAGAIPPPDPGPAPDAPVPESPATPDPGGNGG